MLRRPAWYNDDTQLTVPVPGVGDNTVLSDLVWPLQSAGCVFAVTVSTTPCLSNVLQIIKVFFISPTDALCIYYIKTKIYIKFHTKIAPKDFGLTTILREHIIDLT